VPAYRFDERSRNGNNNNNIENRHVLLIEYNKSLNYDFGCYDKIMDIPKL
jgi:hypothetical protein